MLLPSAPAATTTAEQCWTLEDCRLFPQTVIQSLESGIKQLSVARLFLHTQSDEEQTLTTAAEKFRPSRLEKNIRTHKRHNKWSRLLFFFHLSYLTQGHWRAKVNHTAILQARTNQIYAPLPTPKLSILSKWERDLGISELLQVPAAWSIQRASISKPSNLQGAPVFPRLTYISINNQGWCAGMFWIPGWMGMMSLILKLHYFLLCLLRDKMQTKNDKNSIRKKYWRWPFFFIQVTNAWQGSL